MNINKFFSIFILSALFLGVAFNSHATAEILKDSSIFYQFDHKDATESKLQIQVMIKSEKVAGFRPHALYVKVNGKILKPAQLIERKPREKTKGDKLYTYMRADGGMAVPFTPSAETFDKHPLYALASGFSVPLYKFNLDGLLKPGNNLVELINKTEDRTIKVDFVKFNDNELTSSKGLPPQESATDIRLPKVDHWTSASNVFTIADNADIQVSWRGAPLITAEEISLYPGEKLSSRVEKTVKSETKNWEVINSWTSDKDLPFRKELAVTKDCKEVELNICINQPSFHHKEEISRLTYKIKLPLKTFIGMNYTAICGRAHYLPEIVEGKITSETPNKRLASTRYIVFENDERKIVFDFNPEGVHSFSDYGPTNIQGIWTVEKTPEYLEISFGVSNTDYGGMMNSKLRIFEGNSDDYLKRHSHRDYRYYSELPVETQFCFGAPNHGKSFIQAGNTIYQSSIVLSN